MLSSIPPLLAALFLVPAGPPPAAVTVSKHSPQMLEISLVESGGKTKQRTSLVVPVGGELAAWVRGGDDRRFCRVKAHRRPRSGEIEVDLECGHHRTGPSDLVVEAERAFPRGTAVLIGEVGRADGGRIEVRVELR